MVVRDVPFSPPSASPALVEMWRNNLRKSQMQQSQGNQRAEQAAQPTTIVINFDGGGLPLVAGAAGSIPEVSFPCTIVGCHLYAGVVTSGVLEPIAATASIELRIGAAGAWGSGSTPIYGSSRPSMTLDIEAVIPVDDWAVTSLQPGDLLPSCMRSFTGSATILTLNLIVRRIDVQGIGVDPIVDESGNPIVDESGNPVVLRS